MSKVLITGGTGLIGRHLIPMLRERGYRVALLSRSRPRRQPGSQNQSPPAPIETVPSFIWDPDHRTMDPTALEYAENIIHLAGENLGGGRWTAARKKRILDSRIQTIDTLLLWAEKEKVRPATLISASAVGYYGTISSGKTFSEEDPPGEDFTGQVCRLWEEAADRFADKGSRVVKLRTGVVLSGKGGAFPRLAGPAKRGLAAVVGSGRQYFPWIHMEDLCRMYLLALENTEMKGAYNAVAPGICTNQEFTHQLSGQLGRSAWLPPLPPYLLRLALGEMSVLLTEGSRISCSRIREAGFTFLRPRLENALANLLHPKKKFS